MLASRLSRLVGQIAKDSIKGQSSSTRRGYVGGTFTQYLHTLKNRPFTTTVDKAHVDGSEQKEKISVTFVDKDGEESLIEVPVGMSMLEAAHENDIELEGERKSPGQRAVCEFLKGKVLDAFPDYRKEAEDHLSKAVKLNPSLADAWLCLGNCIWKKGDLPSAKNCLSLALSKGPNKKILCQLSMLERRIAQGTENQTQLVEESIRHAKEAVLLDIQDGNSWYILGNACLTNFFVTGAWDHAKLQHSLKAYQNAEKDDLMKSYPDLYFNCAIANKYLENYERALCGFEAAALKDPGLNADEEVQKIISLLDKLESLIRGQSRAKRLVSLVSSLSEVDLKLPYRKATINILTEGLNKGVAVVAKVLLFIKHDNIAPLYYVTCDSDQTLFILTVYGLQGEAIKEGDRVTLLEPYHRVIDFSWKSKHYHFKAIRVDFGEQILVNEKTPAPHHAVRASILAQHKP